MRGPQRGAAERPPVRLPEVRERDSRFGRARRVEATEEKAALRWMPARVTAVTAEPVQTTPSKEQGRRCGPQLSRTPGFGSELLKAIRSFDSSDDGDDDDASEVMGRRERRIASFK